MKRLRLLRGLPGSGKSHTSLYQLGNKPWFIFATDDYWLRPDDFYDFNYELITEAHKWNQKRVFDAMNTSPQYDIMVDNVNTTIREMMPYIMLAQQFEYEVELVESNAPWKYDVEECYNRNTHGVPYSTILRMYHEWESTSLVKEKLIEMGVKVQ